MTNALVLVFVFSVLLPQSVSAGALYGTVRVGQTPADRVEIKVACPRFSTPGQPPPRVTSNAVTDQRGSFSLRVEATGRCEMQLQRNGRAGTPFEVFVSNNALRFDLEVGAAMNRR